MAVKSKEMSVYTRLFNYDVNKKDEREFIDTCEYCQKEFSFKKKDVKNRMIKCPNCGKDLVFFGYEYEFK